MTPSSLKCPIPARWRLAPLAHTMHLSTEASISHIGVMRAECAAGYPCGGASGARGRDQQRQRAGGARPGQPAAGERTSLAVVAAVTCSRQHSTLSAPCCFPPCGLRGGDISSCMWCCDRATLFPGRWGSSSRMQTSRGSPAHASSALQCTPPSRAQGETYTKRGLCGCKGLDTLKS